MGLYVPTSRRRIPDKNLDLRKGVAAITSVGGDRTDPDYVSDYLDLGPGEYIGAVELTNVAITLANADNIVEIHVVGANDAETSRRTLATFLIAAHQLLTDTDNIDFTKGPVSIFFSNNVGGAIYPKVRLEVVTDGTASGFTANFNAFITRGVRS
jgi:hypothetical protein